MGLLERFVYINSTYVGVMQSDVVPTRTEEGDVSGKRKRSMSAHTVAVLRALAEGTSYGFDIMDATGLPSGTVYPILSRMEERGLVESRWEAVDAPRDRGRPPRKYYGLTSDGTAALHDALERMRALTRPLPGEAR